MRRRTLGLFALVAVVAIPDGAHATRGRVAFADLIGVGGAAVFGPSYRARKWTGTPYFHSMNSRFYRNYPLNRNLYPNPTWNRLRW